MVYNFNKNKGTISNYKNDIPRQSYVDGEN